MRTVFAVARITLSYLSRCGHFERLPPMAGFDGRGNFSPGTYRPGLFSSHHPADLDTVTGCGVCSCSASLDKLKPRLRCRGFFRAAVGYNICAKFVLCMLHLRFLLRKLEPRPERKRAGAAFVNVALDGQDAEAVCALRKSSTCRSRRCARFLRSPRSRSSSKRRSAMRGNPASAT